MRAPLSTGVPVLLLDQPSHKKRTPYVILRANETVLNKVAARTDFINVFFFCSKRPNQGLSGE